MSSYVFNFLFSPFSEIIRLDYKCQSLPMREYYQINFQALKTSEKVWKCSSMGDDQQLFLAFVLSGLLNECNTLNNTVCKKNLGITWESV